MCCLSGLGVLPCATAIIAVGASQKVPLWKVAGALRNL
jgi:hypothetical protein